MDEPETKQAAWERLLHSPIETLADELSAGAFTDEERDLIAAGGWARHLIQKPGYKSCHIAMVAARRLYAVAYIEMQRLIKAETPATAPLTEDALVYSAGHAAAAEFEIRNLFHSMVDSVMPWLADTIDTRIKEDEKTRQAELQAGEEARRKRPVPVGLEWDPPLADLPGSPLRARRRDRSLVLAGWAPGIVYLLDHVMTSALAAREDQVFSVIRLTGKPMDRTSSSSWLTQIPIEKWRGCANTQRSLAVLVHEVITPQLSQPPDLLIVDDLASTYTTAYAGRPAPAAAGDGHKRLAAWCKQIGCALVGGVVSSEQTPPDIRDAPWEQLRTFTDLRPVRVFGEGTAGLAEGQTRLRVGLAVQTFDVDSSVLVDPFAPKLIVPGGNQE